MAEPRACPVCGASNPAGADWCGQCYARFGEHERATAEVAVVGAGSTPAKEGRSAAPIWTCTVCEEVNPISATECSVCGSSMLESSGATTSQFDIEPAVAVLWSAIPGAGLAKAGQGLLGLSAGLLIGMALSAGALFLPTGADGIGVVLILVGLVVWGITAHDAHRFATGDTEGVLLRPRILTFVGGGVIALMALAFIITSAQVGRQ
ncbi:MAG: hypothetical protein ACE5MI_12790 [Acidimicrobiia bacterium]